MGPLGRAFGESGASELGCECWGRAGLIDVGRRLSRGQDGKCKGPGVRSARWVQSTEGPRQLEQSEETPAEWLAGFWVPR